jgi:hypothetical protein
MIIQKDLVGLAKSQPIDTLPDECLMAIQTLNSIHLQVDADQALAENQTLWDTMLSESSRLLEAARYDVSQYAQWAIEKANL